MTRVYVYTAGLVAFVAGTSSIDVRPSTVVAATTTYELKAAMDLPSAREIEMELIVPA